MKRTLASGDAVKDSTVVDNNDITATTTTNMAATDAMRDVDRYNNNNKNNNNKNNSNNNNGDNDNDIVVVSDCGKSSNKIDNTSLNTENVAEGQNNEYIHPFWFVNTNMPASYWDYENAIIEFNNDEPYELIQKIGRGKYSEVFRSRNRFNGELCVLKILKPVRLKKIRREITILQNLCGGPNVLRLLDVVMVPWEETPVLVTENIEPADTFRTLMSSNELTNFDMRFYLYEVLRCLHFAHSRGIFHRDIKPQNIIIDHKRRKLRIVDWGLAEYYIHGQAYNVCVGTRHYKGPELLVGLRLYDYSLDIWSVGCILAEMLFRTFPFFRGENNESQLVRIVDVFGTEELVRYLQKYDITLPRNLFHRCVNIRRSKKSWYSFITSRSSSWCDIHAIDLLDKMLRFDHRERILAEDAMRHPFFDPVRKVLERQALEGYPQEGIP